MEQDAVILDIMVPKKDGLEICRKVRGSAGGVPILMLTAKSQVDFKKFETIRGGQRVDLPAREYALPRFLIKHRDRAP